MAIKLVRVFYIFKNRKFPEQEDNVTGSYFRSQQKNPSQIAWERSGNHRVISELIVCLQYYLRASRQAHPLAACVPFLIFLSVVDLFSALSQNYGLEPSPPPPFPP